MIIYWVIFKRYSERHIYRTQNNHFSLMGLFYSSCCTKSDLYRDDQSNKAIPAKGMTFNQNSHTGVCTTV